MRLSSRGNRDVPVILFKKGFRDQVVNLLAGSIVEVTGRATLDDRGEVRKLSEVIDVDTVSMEPLRISRFEYAGRRYQLATPVTVTVAYSDGLLGVFK